VTSVLEFDDVPFGPQFLERFEVLGHVGKGFSGVVLEALDRTTGARVAIKYFSARTVEQGEFVRRFAREARILSSLDHPNVLRVYDYGFDGPNPYLTEELLDGWTLAQVLKRHNRLSLGVTLSIASQVADALAHAHERNIVHRDVKPGNVFLSKSCLVTLIDFGLARDLLDANRITGAGKIVGTIYFMAPEQVLGEPATAATDLYALGLVVYTMLTGRLPFSTDKATMLHEKVHGVAASLDEAETDEKPPKRLVQLTDRLLRREPLKRPRRAADVAEVLMALCKDYGTAQTSWKIFD